MIIRSGASQQGFVDRIPNISMQAVAKADGCNAEAYILTPETCADNERHAGMNVAPHLDESRLHFQRRFGHAVDNPGNFAGTLADRPALERWRQPDSSTPGCSGSSSCHQPHNRA